MKRFSFQWGFWIVKRVDKRPSEITYKLLNGKVEKAIERELAGIKRVKKDASPELSTRLKHMIVSVEGKTEKKDIRDFVDNYLLARDSRAFREHVVQITPDVDFTSYFLCDACGASDEIQLPITTNFFWPSR